jgi:hypothetical protein
MAESLLSPTGNSLGIDSASESLVSPAIIEPSGPLPYLVGGTEYTIGDDILHVFRDDGTLEYVGTGEPVLARVLAVGPGAGGGGAALNVVGGPGGGGETIDITVEIDSTQAVVIGDGGLGGDATGTDGQPGGQTSLGTLVIADPGGEGAGTAGVAPGSRATGGGGAGVSSADPGGLGDPGGDGGDGFGSGTAGFRASGGAGGAGGDGVDAASSVGGNGGPGILSDITGTSTGYGGGGGGAAHSGTRGTGTHGGGNGDVADTTAGSAGEDYRGGGAGAVAAGSSGAESGLRGGKGVLMVRHPMVVPSQGSLDRWVKEALLDNPTFLTSFDGIDITAAGQDLSPNNRDFSVASGTPVFPDDAPMVGATKCLRLDGVNDYVSGASVARPTLGSWEVFVKKDPDNAAAFGGTVMARGDNAEGFTTRTFSLSLGAGLVNIRRSSGSNATTYQGIITGDPIDDDDWHHIVWTYFAGTNGYQAYVDGLPLAPVTTSGGLNNTADPIYVGTVIGSGSFASMRLGGAAEYGVILSAERVAARYAAAFGG